MGNTCDERLDDIDDIRQERDDLFEEGDESWIDKDDEWEEAWNGYVKDGCCDDCDDED